MLTNRFVSGPKQKQAAVSKGVGKVVSKRVSDLQKQFDVIDEYDNAVPELEKCIMYIYGPAKAGKTTFAANNKHALFIATEQGMNFVKAKRIFIKDWEDFISMLDMLEKEGVTALCGTDIKTFVVDTVDNLWQFCFKFVCNARGIEYPATNDWGKDWDALKREWANAITRLVSMGLGVWFIGH